MAQDVQSVAEKPQQFSLPLPPIPFIPRRQNTCSLFLAMASKSHQPSLPFNVEEKPDAVQDDHPGIAGVAPEIAPIPAPVPQADVGTDRYSNDLRTAHLRCMDEGLDSSAALELAVQELETRLAQEAARYEQ